MSNILLVEDDEILSDTLIGMLEAAKFVPTWAADAETGFEKALTLKPSLFLIDLRLPGTSGVELCKRLRSAGIRTPIIILSGISDEIEKVLLLELGADDFV